MRPMLATRSGSKEPPTGAGWSHEVKWDGMRVLATVQAGRLRLTSRNENDVTVSFPELQGLAGLGHDVVLDGEIVAFTDGRPIFGALADRMHVSNARKAEMAAARNPVTLMVFDVLMLDGQDLCGLTLEQRRARLEGLLPDSERWLVPPAYDDGQVLWEATKAQGLEGVVSKRLDSRYRPGERSDCWLKFPHRPTGSYVVGGWRVETGARARLGALLVGEPTPDGLVYRGRVGSGLAGRASQHVTALLEPLTSEVSPFCDPVPAVDAKGTTWVRPELVVEIASLGFTPQHRLRQPAYLGVRPELRPSDLAALEEQLDA